MKKRTPADFDFTKEQIAREMVERNNTLEYSGETCYKCKKTANIADKEHGWFCTCGSYNQGSRHGQFPHEHPDLGPTSDVIKEGVQLFKSENPDHWISKYLQK